jgi:site-specific recombinase XerD
LTLDELRKLDQTPFDDRVKQFFLFACFTGLRLSDLMQIKWSDFEQNILRYTQKKQGNNQTHYLPLSAQALNLLKDIKNTQRMLLKEQSDFVFIHVQEKRLMNRHLKAWAKKAKLYKNIHIHVARHTFATLSLTNGVSLYTVSKMLGHSKISTTQIYAEVIDEVKQRAAEMMPLL